MPVLAAIAYNVVHPHWDMLKRSLAQRRFSSLTIFHAKNLVGHAIGMTALAAAGRDVGSSPDILFP